MTMESSRASHEAHQGVSQSQTSSLGSGDDDELSQRVFELNADAIVIVDGAGRIVRINPQTETLFGYTPAQLLGRPIERLLPPRFRRKHIQHRTQFATTPQARPMGTTLALFGRRRDGSEFPVAVSLSPIHLGTEDVTIATIRDISVQRQLEHQAHAEGHDRIALLATVLEDVPCGVIVVYGAEARLVLVNHHMEALWGVPSIMGQPLMDFLQARNIELLASDGQTTLQDAWAFIHAHQQGHAVSQEQVIRRSDGTRVPVLVSAAELDPAVLEVTLPHVFGSSSPQPPQTPVGMIACQDISALKAITRLKDEFIALISHELRTPMAVIRGYAETLGRVPASDATVDDQEWAQWQVEAREAIAQATARLARLTEDLLEISQVQAGEISLRAEPVDLVGLTRRTTEHVQASTAHHQLHFSATEERLVALLDPSRMEQVLTQLLSNAVKFSPGGGEIEVSLRRDAPGTSAVLAVRDHGIGIPAEQHPQIFERFVRADNAQQQGIPGRGLGLYLAREFVRRQGGRLWFESGEGRGSTFTMSLPLADNVAEEL